VDSGLTLARRAGAEGLAAFALVFAGCGAIVADQRYDGTVGIALVFGLVIMVMVYPTGHLSGAHINPAVAMAFTLTRHFPAREAAAYIGAQLAGATAGALARPEGPVQRRRETSRSSSTKARFGMSGSRVSTPRRWPSSPGRGRSRRFSRPTTCSGATSRRRCCPPAASTTSGCFYGPLAHGLLTGAFDEDTTFAADDWRSGAPFFKGDAYRRNLEVVRELGRFATEQLGVSVSRLAIAWTLANPAVHIAIVGARHPGHIEDSVAATDLNLSGADLEEIGRIMADSVPLSGPSPEMTPE